MCISAINQLIYTRSSAIAEGPRDAISQLKSCRLLSTMRNIPFLKVCN